MAATDHTRLRSARSSARRKSTDDRRIAPRSPAATLSRGAIPRATTALPTDTRTHPGSTPVSGVPVPSETQYCDEQTSAESAPGQPPADRQFPDAAERDAIRPEPDGDTDSPPVFSPDELPPAGPDEPQCAAPNDSGGLPSAGPCAALFGSEELSRAARIISDIHAQLALAYAYALTFQRAVRDFIPADELDILPCLSTGVIDVLDTQLPRLDNLLDHLTRAAALVPAGPAGGSSPRVPRHSRRARIADDPEAVFGIVHGTPTDGAL